MKSINIKGKSYNPVNERIKEFHKLYPNGKIVTKILSNSEGIIVMQAIVWPDAEKKERYFTGHAHEWQDDPRSMVNKTSYIENCETSCIGRALGSLGIGIDEGFASADEVTIAQSKIERSEGVTCEKCGNPMSLAEKLYSQKIYKVEYCRECQKELKKTDSPF